jgi:hypothetical protein
MDQQSTEIQIPAGFCEVSKDEFFSELYKDQRDIMPVNIHKMAPSVWCETWETKNKYVWGWSAWGSFGTKEVFALKVKNIS